MWREVDQDHSMRVRASFGIGEMKNEELCDLGCGTGASGRCFSSEGVILIAARPGQSGREENHKWCCRRFAWRHRAPFL